jgi:type I site-specific restriction endonuclease
MRTLTPEQVQNLREEFVDFKINEMSREEMADWIRTVFLDELERCTVDELEYEINSYDDNLYEILTDYVTDTVGSYTALQEFIHDRHAMEWIDD